MSKNLQGLKVLVVEDDAMQAMAYCDILADLGAETLGPFSTATAACAAISSSHIDVAVIDFALGDGNANGLEDALELRGIPYIVVTGFPKVLVRHHEQQVIYGKPLPSQMLSQLVATMAREAGFNAHQ